MEVENNPERVIERPGKENINVKLANNTGKKPQTAKIANRPRGEVRRFRNALGRKNYIGKRNLPLRRRQSQFTGDARKRQRGLRLRRRGVKIIIRNLTRNTTNADIKSKS